MINQGKSILSFLATEEMSFCKQRVPLWTPDNDWPKPHNDFFSSGVGGTSYTKWISNHVSIENIWEGMYIRWQKLR